MLKETEGPTMNSTTIVIPNDGSEEFILGIENPVMDRDENLARIEIATLALIFVTTVLGNATVLLALWTRKREAITGFQISGDFNEPNPVAKTPLIRWSNRIKKGKVQPFFIDGSSNEEIIETTV